MTYQIAEVNEIPAFLGAAFGRVATGLRGAAWESYLDEPVVAQPRTKVYQPVRPAELRGP